MIGALGFAASAAGSAAAFRRWDLERGAEVESWALYGWCALAWPVLLPWGWWTYGRRSRRRR